MSVNLTQQGVFNASGDVNPNLFKTTPKSLVPTAYLAYQIDMLENLIADTTYTFQMWDINVSHAGKTADTLGIRLYWGGGGISLINWKGTAYFTDGHADYLRATITITPSQASGGDAANIWINVYNSPGNASGAKNMSIGKWKLEKGSVATPWVPCEADNIYVGGSHGFNEIDTNTKIYENCIVANNFIEW